MYIYTHVCIHTQSDKKKNPVAKCIYHNTGSFERQHRHPYSIPLEDQSANLCREMPLTAEIAEIHREMRPLVATSGFNKSELEI